MTQAAGREVKARDHAAIVRHIADMDWETIRWPGETGKLLFHPRPEAPDEPNAGLLRLEPGAYHPRHRHDFAQIWYVIEGEFKIAGKLYGPGTMLYHADPHYEDELHTDTGGLMLIVQYPGPVTGGRPIYDKRFNMQKRNAVADERTDI